MFIMCYAIYAAKLVLHIFEDRYPDDKRPREAIKAVNRYLRDTTVKNKKLAADAAHAAYAAHRLITLAISCNVDRDFSATRLRYHPRTQGPFHPGTLHVVSFIALLFYVFWEMYMTICFKPSFKVCQKPPNTTRD